MSVTTRHASPWRIWRSQGQVGTRWQRFANDAQIARPRRWLSTTNAKQDVETHEVRCGASGSIRINIYNSERLSNAYTPLIIYFPSYGAHIHDGKSQIPAQFETIQPKATFAEVNYRWSKLKTDMTPQKDSNIFPIPIHDASFAFDFLTSSYLPNLQTASSSYPTPPSSPTHNLGRPRPIILAGSFLGGTLATSLALTSTYASTRNATHYIAGLITYNAPFDWTSTAVLHPSKVQRQSNVPRFEEDASPSINQSLALSKDKSWTAPSLLGLRATLFAAPGNTFDSFASPVLFFHTPGYIVPTTWPGNDTKPEQDRYSTSLDDNENDDLVFEAPDFDVAGDGLRGEAEIVGNTGSSQNSKKEERECTPQIARTSYLKFPPTVSLPSSGYSRIIGSGPMQEQLKIPRSLFLYSSPPVEITAKVGKSKRAKKTRSTAGLEQITPEAQAKEMARLMHRSVLMVESKDRSRWDDSFDANCVAEERARVLDVGDKDNAEMVKEWFEDCLA